MLTWMGRRDAKQWYSNMNFYECPSYAAIRWTQFISCHHVLITSLGEICLLKIKKGNWRWCTLFMATPHLPRHWWICEWTCWKIVRMCFGLIKVVDPCNSNWSVRDKPSPYWRLCIQSSRSNLSNTYCQTTMESNCRSVRDLEFLVLAGYFGDIHTNMRKAYLGHSLPENISDLVVGSDNSSDVPLLGFF